MRVERGGELHLVLALGRAHHLARAPAAARAAPRSARPWRPRAAERVAGARAARPCRAPPSRRRCAAPRFVGLLARPCGRCRRPCRRRRAARPAPCASSTRPRQHARQRQLAGMAGVDRLHHLQRCVAGSVRDAEALARILDVRRFVAERLQEPQDAVAVRGRADEDRHDLARRAARAARSANTASRGGWMSSRSCSISASSWSASRSSMVKRASSRGAPVVVVELDDLALRVLAVDEGAVEREVDEAGRDAVLQDRDLAQHQRQCGGRLQHRERLAHADRRLVDLVQEQEARDAALLQRRAAPPAAPGSSSRRARPRRSPRRRPPAPARSHS